MCALCGLTGSATGGFGCVDPARDPWPGPGTSESGTSLTNSSAVNAPVPFTLSQITQQLRTQWGGSFEGTTLSWTGSSIPYYIGGTPYASGSGEITYTVAMTSMMVSRATLAFELWDDLIARDLNPASSAASAQIQFEYASRTDNGTGTLTTSGGTYSSPWLQTNGTGPYGTTNYRITRDEVWLNSNWTSHNADNDMYFGGYGFQTYMHEIGHALGLSHPGTYNAGSGGSITYANNAEYTLDNRQYTIMSYFGGYAPGAGWQQDGTFNNWLYSSTPMLHDVMAIQAIYGADMTTRTGDTTYGFHSNAGRDVFNFDLNTTPIITIWDAGGSDTIDLSGYSSNQRVDLRQGAYSDVGGLFNNFAIAYNAIIENAIGGSGNDTFIGNDADNAFRGGLGNDTIDGSLGTDWAVYSGPRSAYTLTDLGGNSIRVVGPDGTDTLYNIERFLFDGQVVIWGAPADFTTSLALSGIVATVVTTNSGGSAGATTSGVYLSADSTITTADTLVGAVNVSASASSSSGNVALAFPGNLTPGTYYIGAIADVGGQVAESDESNNVSNVIAVILGNNSANTLGGGPGNDPMFGLGGNDWMNGAAGQDTLTGGTGADIFAFDSVALANATASTPIYDRITDYNQSGGAYSAAEGDQIDLSAILSAAYNHGSGQPASSLVRAITGSSGTRLQIDTDGAANGANWVTIAQLDGLSLNQTINVILDGTMPAGVNVTVASPAVATKSFNGDGYSDILWQSDGGAPAVWLMNGVNVMTPGPVLSNTDPAWREIAAADFNGDGKADILWQNNNGAPAVWLMDGTSPMAFGPILSNPGPAWKTKDAADFNGDGKADILWQNDNGAPAIWLMDGVNVLSSGAPLPNPGASWKVKAAADFNGDGKADILWQNDNGAAAVWLMNGASVLATGPVLQNLGAAWKAKAAGDFNGDGKADILWQNDNGAPAVWLMDGVNVLEAGAALANPGTAWRVYDAADFDGNGKADILWQSTDGRPAIWLMNGVDVVSSGAALPNPGANWHVI